MRVGHARPAFSSARARLGFPTSARSSVADPTDPPTPPGQQPWPRTPAQPPAWGPGWGPAWGPPPDTAPPGAAPPRTAPPGAPYGPPPERPPSRNPVPRPAGTPRMLRLELGLVLLLAFSPGILGLLLLALGPAGSAEVEAQLVPSVISIVFELFLSWSPVLVVGFLLARNREGWAGIGLTRFRAGDLVMGAVLWVASFILVLVLAQLFQYFGQREVDFLPEGLPLWFRAFQAVLIAVTAGVTEEIVVRGYAQTRLEQLRAPTAAILLLPTALWGVLHVYQGLGAALTIFGLGLMYAWYFQRTRRLWPLILAHTLFDLTQLILILAGVGS
jgi:CAAX protease family protein